MSNLRNEFKKHKTERENYINEAAYAWAEKNIILINEKIDRRTVKRLSDAIVKFDEKFGPFKTKIPALAAQLETAENNLQLVLTGRVDDGSASDMLQQLSYLYKVFSDFFGTDLPIILSTNIFAAAKQNPDVRLDSIQPSEGSPVHNPKVIKDTFRHSIEPSKEEKKLISKIYRKRNMPLIDSQGIADQLLALSYNELQNLAGVEKIPMVATEGEPVQEAIELNESLLTEVDLQGIKLLNADIERLKRVFGPFSSKLPSLNNLVNKLGGQVMQIKNNVGSGAWDKIKSTFGGGVQKNIMATHDMFRDFKELSLQVVKLMGDADKDTPLGHLVSDTNFGNHAKQAIGLLTKTVKPGIFGKGLIDSKSFQNEISSLTLNEIESLANGIELEDTDDINPELNNPVPENSPENQPSPVQTSDVNQANYVPLQPQNSRKRGAVDPIDIGAGNQPAPAAPAAPTQTPNVAAPETVSQTNPGNPPPAPEQPAAPTAITGLSPEEVLQVVSQKKKLNPKLAKSISDSVEWLQNNGFKVSQ